MQDMKSLYSVRLMQVGIFKMAAEIVECSEVDADLVMLCRISKCTADADC